MQKFTFDIRLPQQVTDAVDGSATGLSLRNPNRFVKMDTLVYGTLVVLVLQLTICDPNDHSQPSRIS